MKVILAILAIGMGLAAIRLDSKFPPGTDPNPIDFYHHFRLKYLGVTFVITGSILLFFIIFDIISRWHP